MPRTRNPEASLELVAKKPKGRGRDFAGGALIVREKVTSHTVLGWSALFQREGGTTEGAGKRALSP